MTNYIILSFLRDPGDLKTLANTFSNWVVNIGYFITAIALCLIERLHDVRRVQNMMFPTRLGDLLDQYESH